MGTSMRNLGLALIMALLLHVFILAQELALESTVANYSLAKEKPLTVKFLVEKAEVQALEPTIDNVKNQNQEVLPSQVELNPPTVNADDLIVASKPSKTTEPPTVVQTSPQTTVFKNWLKSETNSFSNENPDSVGEFDQTFSAPLRYESPEELSPFHRDSVPRGSTTFDQEYKGKITCVAKIIDMLDISAQPSYTASDCSRKKKFDLKFNQPNNGWSDR